MGQVTMRRILAFTAGCAIPWVVGASLYIIFNHPYGVGAGLLTLICGGVMLAVGEIK